MRVTWDRLIWINCKVMLVIRYKFYDKEPFKKYIHIWTKYNFVVWKAFICIAQMDIFNFEIIWIF